MHAGRHHVSSPPHLAAMQVMAEAARVLRPGGRIAISDVIRTRELPERLQTEQALAC